MRLYQPVLDRLQKENLPTIVPSVDHLTCNQRVYLSHLSLHEAKVIVANSQLHARKNCASAIDKLFAAIAALGAPLADVFESSFSGKSFLKSLGLFTQALQVAVIGDGSWNDFNTPPSPQYR